MSIASMTEIAYRSRTDVGTATYYPKSLTQQAGAAGGKETPDSEINTALRTLTTYVPTEILTLYVAVLAALGSGGAQAAGQYGPQWKAYYAFLVATPVVVWVVFVTKVKADGKPIPWHPLKWPLWQMVAATIAYVAWAFALPGSPFKDCGSWYSPGIAGIVVLVASTALGLVAPLFARPLEP